MSGVLILKTGSPVPEIEAAHGDYDRMFLDALEPTGVELRVIDIENGGVLPDPADVGGAVITGSPHSVTDRAPWADALLDWTIRARDTNTPLLGVCYGHQLIAEAFGGRVIVNPDGYEIGTIDVELTDAGRADPLFEDLATGLPLKFNSVHADVVVELPPNAQLLAGSRFAPIQAFSLGQHIRCVQFHPEFSRPVIEKFVVARAPQVRASADRFGLDAEAILDGARRSVEATPLGPKLLRRFVERFVER